MDAYGLYQKYWVNRPLTKDEIKDHLSLSEPSRAEPSHRWSVIKMNSTFLECTDKFYEEKGYSIICFSLIFYIFFLMDPDPLFFIKMMWTFIQAGWFCIFAVLLNSFIFLAICWMVYREARYTHCPIRFNRRTRKVHVFRRNGTAMTEDWDKLYFTLATHGVLDTEVRAHRLAEDGETVLETFALPWHRSRSSHDFYSQWEFVRRYMEEGPKELAERLEIVMPIANRRETLTHGFSRYFYIMEGNPFYSLLWLPVTFVVSVFRWIVMHVAKIPVWPPEVEADCRIAPDDPLVLDAPPRGQDAAVWNYATQAPHIIDPLFHEGEAAEFLENGVFLERQKKYDVALRNYEEVERSFGQYRSTRMRQYLAEALCNKGRVFSEQGKSDAANAAYEEVDRRFGQDDSPHVRQWVAKALLEKARVLWYRLIRGGESPSEEEDRRSRDTIIALYDEVDRRFGQDRFPGVLEWVTRALVDKSFDLKLLRKNEAALAVCDEIERRFGQNTSPAVRRHVAEALVNKGGALVELEQVDAAIALFDEIDRRFGREDTYDARSAAFSAAREKASIFEKRGDLDTVIAIYDELDWRFSRSNQDDSRTWAKKVRQRKSEAEQKKGNLAALRAS